jgi:hypothetical protein
VSVAARVYFSIQHIQSAAELSRLCFGLEQPPYTSDNSELQLLITRHKAYVVGSIISCFMFLEANINELFADSYDFKEHGHTRQLSEENKITLGERWVNDISKNTSINVLEKYNLFLELCEKDIIHSGWHVYGNVNILRQVRNRLIHYYPETVDFTNPAYNIGSNEYENLESRLRNKHFKLNPLLPRNIFFPDQCLSHGFTKWAIANSINFVDEFCSRLDISIPYDHVRNNLHCGS